MKPLGKDTQMRHVVWMLVAVLAMVLCSTTYGAVDPNDDGGLTLWGLGGDLSGDGLQEGRVGWMFDKWSVEPAIGIRHLDAVTDEDEVEEWPLMGYLLFHALDADMLAKAFHWEVDLPDGEVYAGPFAQYNHDRDDEWSGGPCIGALVDLGSINPKWSGWSAVTEYDWTIWNVDEKAYTLILGLRRQF
jgi:hypothetical protein